MEKINSKVNDKLISSVLKKSEISSYRTDMSPNEEFLQVCGRILSEGTYVKPHKHKTIIREINTTQESWVVIEGEIEVGVFDVDNELLQTILIKSGDCVTFYRGGHSLLSLKDNTIFYEFKIGPYYGYEKDKENI
jgi:cupin fold WbuC family metalloprotein